MSYLMQDLWENDVLVSSFICWFIAQVLKIFIDAATHRTWDLQRLVGSGGMPSSHSALVIGLCTSIALYDGVRSDIFALSVIVAAVVMYDAAGVRRAAGEQAQILNSLLHEFHQGKGVNDEKLKELLGHTPVEVLAGAVLGFAVAYGMYWVK